MLPGSLTHNASALLAIQIANQLLPLITIPYLTRTLGVEAYGAYAFALAIVMIACVITDFGFNLWATAEVAAHRDDNERIKRLYGSVTAVKLMLTTFVVFVIFIYAANSVIAAEYRSVLYWTVLPIIGITFQPVWLFNGLERMAYLTIFVLVSRIAFIALTFTLVTSVDDLALLMGVNGLAQIIAALLGFGVLRRFGYVPSRPKLVACREVLKQASPFFLSRIAVSTYTAGGALFLGVVAGTRSVAIFAVAEQLYRGALALLSPLSQVMYPYMMRTRNYRLLMWTIAGATLVASVGSGLAFFLDAHIITLLFTNAYIESLPVLHIFLIAIIVNTPSVLLGYPMLGALGKVSIANHSVLFAGVLQLIVLYAWYALERTSPVDVAIAVLIAELSVLIVRSYCSGRELLSQKRI